MANEKNIQIDKDEWIEWKEVSSEENVLFIDDLLAPSKKFWTRLEMNCVTGCCGFDAYSFMAKDIKEVSAEFETIVLKYRLNNIYETIKKAGYPAIDSDLLCCTMTTDTFLLLLEHVLENIEVRFIEL